MPCLADGPLFSWGKKIREKTFKQMTYREFLNCKENWGQKCCLTPNKASFSCASLKQTFIVSVIVGYFICIC